MYVMIKLWLEMKTYLRNEDHHTLLRMGNSAHLYTPSMRWVRRGRERGKNNKEKARNYKESNFASLLIDVRYHIDVNQRHHSGMLIVECG